MRKPRGLALEGAAAQGLLDDLPRGAVPATPQLVDTLKKKHTEQLLIYQNALLHP